VSDTAILGFVGGIVLGVAALLIGILRDRRDPIVRAPPSAPTIDETHEYRLDSPALDESGPDVTTTRGDDHGQG
jgi:hypothetical protein